MREGHACEVIKTQDGETWFVTLENTPYCAHGESFRDAVTAAKEKQNPGSGRAEALARVRESGNVTLSDFSIITGACRAGATLWAKQQRIPLTSKMSVAEVLDRLKDSPSRSWGERFRDELAES